MIINAELAIVPAFGWQGGPEFNTLIKRMRSGRERRRSLQEVVQHRYTLPFQNITDSAYLLQLKSAFLAARGAAYTFRAKDYSDYQAEHAIFGAGDGVETEFDLYVPHVFGDASYLRLILYPVDPVFYVDEVVATATFDTDTKKVVFDSAPADNAVLSWDGEFRVLVRFANDTFPMTIDNRSGQNYVLNGSIELMEVWE
jgi:uncharacterized protein (TIGR02217 family)